MKQGTYYLSEDEHRDFKAKCAADGVSITEKIRSLVCGYIDKPIKEEDKSKEQLKF